MWMYTKNWPEIQRSLEFLRREWIWPAAYTLACLLVFFNPPLFAVISGIALLGAELNAWLRSIGREVNLRGILRSTVLLTMWVAPAIAWWGAGATWYTGHIMPVSEAVYWSLAAPGVAALNLALRWPWPAFLSERWSLSTAPAALILIPLGLAGQLALPWAPPVLHLPAHLCAQLVFVGLLYGILAWPTRRWWWVSAGMLYAGTLALQTTFFGAGLMWCLMMLLSALKGKAISAGWRYGLAGGGVLALAVLLSFKYEYRKVVQETDPAQPALQVFTGMLWEQITHPERCLQPEAVETIVNRFNQGYYTAQAMAWTPAQEPFTCGKTIADDAWAALIPRFIDPDKHQAGGFNNMKRFAGVSGRSYSMNIGIFGEVYVNFGIAGGAICLLGYGLLLNALMALAFRYLDAPWWPYLFLPALHVESDIGIVWNHLTKAGLVAISLIVLIRLFQKYR
jgi:hypothetical protein